MEEIIIGRGEITFQDVNDFLRRVDLRKVGKRALESLIQVGALDDFGSRPALLESMDRILSISSSNFQAADAGQISMFGDGTGLTESIKLPASQNPDQPSGPAGLGTRADRPLCIRPSTQHSHG